MLKLCLTYPPLKYYSKNKQYKDNLQQSGYNKKLTYKPTDSHQEKHTQHMVWSYGLNPHSAEMFLQKSKKSYTIETKSKLDPVACKALNQL